jgi:hypothetical protein
MEHQWLGILEWQDPHRLVEQLSNHSFKDNYSSVIVDG